MSMQVRGYLNMPLATKLVTTGSSTGPCFTVPEHS